MKRIVIGEDGRPRLADVSAKSAKSGDSPYPYELKTPPRPPPALPYELVEKARKGLRSAQQIRMLNVLIARPGMTLYELALATHTTASSQRVRLTRLRRALERNGLTVNRPTGGVYFGGDRKTGVSLWIEEWNGERND